MCVFDTAREYWTLYRNVLGTPVVFDGNLYMFIKGRLYKEVTNVGYVGTGAFTGNVSSGGVGWIIVNSSTALPTSNEEGLPCYVDKTVYWINDITDQGSNNYKVWLNTSTNFSSASKYTVGTIRCYFDTAFMDQKTIGRNKLYVDLLTAKYKEVSGGEMEITVARNNGTFDTTFTQAIKDTTSGSCNTLLRVRDKNIAFRFEWLDGADRYDFYGFEFPYMQESKLD
jgi:hypothetical protein